MINKKNISLIFSILQELSILLYLYINYFSIFLEIDLSHLRQSEILVSLSILYSIFSLVSLFFIKKIYLDVLMCRIGIIFVLLSILFFKQIFCTTCINHHLIILIFTTIIFLTKKRNPYETYS